MAEIVLMKAGPEALIPFDEGAAEFIRKAKTGSLVHADFKKMRNYEFHKKYFALINFAFEQWEPSEVKYKGVTIAKNVTRFRKDMAILAGFCDATFTVNGDVRFEPRSISFASMDEIEFEKLYSKTIDVVLARILTKYTRADLDEVVARLLQFTWSGR
tara:strand:+ start:435784 stop:436257 length:474 start_codon:yes stop_codon:yes gene_type:complete